MDHVQLRFNMVYNKICLMLPTYGRAKTYLPRFVETAEEMSTNICFSFCVNEGDMETINYLNGRKWKFEYEIIYENLPSPHLAKYFNLLYNNSKWNDNKEVVVSQMGDDMEFRTTGWDTKMLALINKHNGIGVFWANDDFIAREKMCVNLFVTRDFVEATEHKFMCELFAAEMIDYLWYKVGKYTQTLHFDPDIHIWHNHGSQKPDRTFMRLESFRKAAWVDGKVKAKVEAARIADILKKKGMVGNSIC